MQALTRDVVSDLAVSASFEHLGVVRGDESELRRVMLNLVGNASKYRRADVGLHLEITSEHRGDHIEFSVADNGQGIEPEYQEKVFDLFSRLHHQDDIAGTGLGLSVVRRIVTLHGGRIWVGSEGAGKGSTFRFTLPTP